MAQLEVNFDASDLTPHGRQLIASALYSKGRSFVGASVLLQKHGGDEYVVLHLLCQGIEIILKALLLFLDYQKYDKLQRKFGHDLNKVTAAAIEGYRLQPLRPALAAEVTLLTVFIRSTFCAMRDFRTLSSGPVQSAASIHFEDWRPFCALLIAN